MTRALLGLALLLIPGCSYRFHRAVALGDVPAEQGVWAVGGERPGQVFYVREGFAKTWVSTEPTLRKHVRTVLDAELGLALDGVRVTYASYLYPSHPRGIHDGNHFVLRVELESETLSGEFEGTISGTELKDLDALLGRGWATPFPGWDLSPGYRKRAEQTADKVAHRRRLLLRLAVDRLVESVRAAAAG